MRLTLLVQVLKQMLARQILHLADELQQLAICQFDLLYLARLGLVAKPQFAPVQRSMPAAQCRRSKTLVLFSVKFVSDPHEAQIEQTDDTCHRPIAPEAG